MNRDYDYISAMKEDILVAVDEMIQFNEITRKSYERDDLVEFVSDKLWDEDSVTGNGSGSYWFSRYKAEEAICHNIWLYEEALDNFCTEAVLEPETIDVTIRCYLLPQVLSEMIEEGAFNNLIKEKEI